MASGYGGETARQINRLFHDGTTIGLTDGQLIERFTTRRAEAAEAAFEALVKRHGPMVLRVIRGILRDPHDVEDAFQATFLVLVQKAHSIGERDLLAPWLYGVANRVALKARSLAARRNKREGGLIDDPPGEVAEVFGFDLRPILHEELNRLPDKYKKPVVLCHLQGLTHAEAAQELAWPVGTVSVRLTRARKLLKDRLTRRGLTVTATLWASGLMAEGATAAIVPQALIQSTARAALAALTGKLLATGTISAGAILLSKRTLTMMLMSRLKWLALPLAMGVGAAGGVVVNQQITLRSADGKKADLAKAEAAKPPEPESPTPPAPNPSESPFEKFTPFGVDLPRAVNQPPDRLANGGGEKPAEIKVKPPVVIREGQVLLDPPPGYFDLPAPNKNDGTDPPIIKVGQWIEVEVLETLPGRPITGVRVVRPDGTISLGFYGSLRVVGLNRDQAKVKLLGHLREYITDEVLGLVSVHEEGDWYAIPPIKSMRVFVDDFVSEPPLRKSDRESIGGDRLSYFEGKLHLLTKEVQEAIESAKQAKVDGSAQTKVGKSELVKSMEKKGVEVLDVGPNFFNVSSARLEDLERQLLKALKELKDLQRELDSSEPATTPPSKPTEKPPG